jgi:hypothetical protein
VSGIWIYAVVASLHLPGIAILALLLRDLSRSDPPDAPEAGPPDGGPPPGWRWRRRPRPGGGRSAAPERARTPR